MGAYFQRLIGKQMKVLLIRKMRKSLRPLLKALKSINESRQARMRSRKSILINLRRRRMIRMIYQRKVQVLQKSNLAFPYKVVLIQHILLRKSRKSSWKSKSFSLLLLRMRNS